MKRKLTNRNSPFTIIILGAGFFAFILLFVFVYFWYQKSCLKDHSNSAKKLVIPMEKNISVFIKEHQRFPTLKESEILFEKSGCNSMKQTYYEEINNDAGEVYQRLAAYNCTNNLKTNKYGLRIADLTTVSKYSVNAYEITFSRGNTHCVTRYLDNGELKHSFSCQQFSCFKLDH